MAPMPDPPTLDGPLLAVSTPVATTKCFFQTKFEAIAEIYTMIYNDDNYAYMYVRTQ